MQAKGFTTRTGLLVKARKYVRLATLKLDLQASVLTLHKPQG